MCVGGGGGGEGAGGPDPTEKLQNYKVLSNIGPDPLKNHKAIPSQHSILGQYRPASETSFKWRFAGG